MKKYIVTIDYGNVEKWYFNGKLHRENGPAINFDNKIKEWYFNGKLHRTDGPAVEWPDGSGSWYFEGKQHRLNGPARDWKIQKQWWINGKQLTETEFNEKIKQLTCENKLVEIDDIKYKLTKLK